MKKIFRVAVAVPLEDCRIQQDNAQVPASVEIRYMFSFPCSLVPLITSIRTQYSEG
jgi:uncharacterized protein YfcZ (UPF0381/DUF406 family)